MKKHKNKNKLISKDVILTFIFGVLTGPIVLGILYLITLFYKTSNIFIIIILLLIATIIYKVISLFIISKLSESDIADRIGVISIISMFVTYVVCFHFFSNEGWISSIIMAVIPLIFQAIIFMKDGDFGPGPTSNTYNTYNSYNDKPVTVEKNIWGDNVYKKGNKVIGVGEKNIFGDEVIKDKSGNKKATIENDFFGTKVKDSKGKVQYEVDKGFFGDTLKGKNGNDDYNIEKGFFVDTKFTKKKK